MFRRKRVKRRGKGNPKCVSPPKGKTINMLSLYSEEELNTRLRERQAKVNRLKKKREITGLTPDETGVLTWYSLEIKELQNVLQSRDSNSVNGSYSF